MRIIYIMEHFGVVFMTSYVLRLELLTECSPPLFTLPE